ncbi:MAG: J domain-containing protein [Acidobacteria bacterium]|nr:J domain-containing protein [Acidobacteriota bacterium]
MASSKSAEKDYYAVLNVSSDAPLRTIKQNYRSLVQRNHPDLFRSKEDAEAATLRMIEINEAFSVLSNKRRRAEYDIRRTASTLPVREPEPESPLRTPTGRQPQHSSALDRAVIQEFLQALKKSIAQQGAALKIKEEAEKSWVWSFSAKTWNRIYWVGLRHLPMLNMNTTREMLAQLTSITIRKRSLWKNSAFIFVLAAESFQEADQVLKLCRSYCVSSENMTRSRRVNIIILELSRRVAILCGRRSQDPKLQKVLNVLGSA